MFTSSGTTNLVILAGNIGSDPRIINTQDNKVLAFFDLATDDSYKDRTGTKVDQTTWVPCKAFGKSGEIIRDHVFKGTKLQIIGKESVYKKKLIDPSDNREKNYTFMEVEVVEFTFLSAKQESQPTRSQNNQKIQKPSQKTKQQERENYYGNHAKNDPPF